MSGKTILIIILAVVFGVAAAVYATTALNRPQTVEVREERIPVVIATQAVSRGTTLTREMIRIKEISRDSVPAGAIQRLEDALDKVAEIPLVKDDLVLEGKLAKGAGGGASAVIPAGKQVKAILMDNAASSVAGLVRPKDRVNVLSTTERFYTDDRSGGGTVLLLQHVEVFSVENRLEVPPPQDGKPGEAREVKAIGLLVSPKEAAILEQAQKQGKLSLVLRNPSDEEVVRMGPITMADLPYPPAPTKPGTEGIKEVALSSDPPSLPPIRVFRNTNMGEVSPK